QIYSYFLPLDFYPIMLRFAKKTKANSLYLCETDFWPSLLHICKRLQINCYLINGRISDSLSSNLMLFQKSAIQNLLALNQVFVQYPSDKEKLSGLIKQDRIHVFGNAKFDLLKTATIDEKYKTLKKNSRQVCMLGSFHPDEYHHFIKSFQKFQDRLLFVIAPRNLHTISKLIAILQSNNLSFVLSSNSKDLATHKSIVILDEMGVLSHLYQYCHLAFVGGSFNQVGGHNFLEPILYKKPVFVGPNVRNYQHDILEFLKNEYIWQVQNSSEIQSLIASYLNQPKPFIESSLKANQHLKNYQGVLKKTWENIS
ncbi:hypothetical protein MJH12_14975, partial [bacterium]|nr:hypothetical protein [bacterium]